MFEKLQERLEATFKKYKLRESNRRQYQRLSQRSELPFSRQMLIIRLSKTSSKNQRKSYRRGRSYQYYTRSVFVKIVHEELCSLLGQVNKPLDVSGSPPVSIMLIGLQGSGKRQRGQACPSIRKRQKTAACAFRHILSRCNRPTHENWPANKHCNICIKGHSRSHRNLQRSQNLRDEERLDTMIVDTAGRLHINDEMVEELIKQKNC